MPNDLYKYIMYSLLCHIVIVFIFSMKWHANYRMSYKDIDVTLVTQFTSKAPEHPDYLAKVSNLGGGTEKTKKILSSEKQPDQLPLLSRDNSTPLQWKPEFKIDILPEKIAKKTNYIAMKQSNTLKSPTDKIINDSPQDPQIQPDIVAETPITTADQIVSLITRINDRTNLLAKRPQRRFISSSTVASSDAEYLLSWKEKIEYFGNKYYPKQIAARNLSGEVLLSVAIRTDGSIEAVRIEKSSGIKILDEAAVQTAYMAAPFAPFDIAMRKNTDILEVVRTWRFNHNTFSTG